MKDQCDLDIVRNSPFFSAGFYLDRNQDVASSGADPAEHFLVRGGLEGRDPGPSFSSRFYLKANPELIEARVNPLVHYEKIGKSEGRDIQPVFDACNAAYPKTYPYNTYSKFGGFWIDRRDWPEVIATKESSGEITTAIAKNIARFCRDGYIIFERAVPKDVTTRLRDEIDRFWRNPPEDARIETWTNGKPTLVRPEISFRDRSKLVGYHGFSALARGAIAAPAVVEFLSAIFEARPKVFQTLVFWRGSQQDIHRDTAYVQVSRAPMELAASWLALEDVEEGTGELEYIVGSHRDPDFLFEGRHKWLPANSDEHPRFLRSIQEDALKYRHERKAFLPREGDVLIWHADLAHGGAPIRKPGKTRQSLVTHFTTEYNDPPYRERIDLPPALGHNCFFMSEYTDIHTGDAVSS